MPSPSTTQRVGRPRRTAIAWVAANHPHICHLCTLPIDMTADRRRHPLGFHVDELTPVKYGGSITDHDNLRPAHAVCNESRGAKPITPEVRARCRQLALAAMTTTPTTTRTW